MNKIKSLKLKQDFYRGLAPDEAAGMDALYHMVDYENYSPVKRLEEGLGISGIYHDYRFPEGMTPEGYEALMKPARVVEMLERGYYPEQDNERLAVEKVLEHFDEALSLVKGMYEELCLLNPEIASIVPVRQDQVRAYVLIVSGVCSGFPPEDIRAFNDARKESDNQALNRRRQEMSEEIENLSGRRGEKFVNPRGETGYFSLIRNWCPSEETYRRILKKTREKYRPRALVKQARVYD